MSEENTQITQNTQNGPWQSTYAGGAPAGGTLPEREEIPFSVTWREIAAALLMFPAAWLYVESFIITADSYRFLALGFLALFVGICELLNLKKERPKESWFWLVMMLAVWTGVVLRREAVWDEAYGWLFLHGFGVWYALCRSGVLLEKKSGRLLPADLINGFLVLPFSHFFLRLRTVFAGLFGGLSRKSEEKKDRSGLIWGILAALLALLLFGKALGLLAESSEQFGSFTERVREMLRIDWDEDTLATLLLSLPVGAYLFGLLGGALRQKESAREDSVRGIDRFLRGMKKVPDKVWEVILIAFLLLYGCYFAVEAGYYVSALVGRLPEEYTASAYAREGFFELCRVMAINFLLLWLASRSSQTPLQSRRSGRILGTLLLAESLLLAVSAFSKLLLYIDRFGFTPLRLEAAWLTVLLFVGCIAAAVTFLTGKKTFRLFLYYGALSLAAMYLF